MMLDLCSPSAAHNVKPIIMVCCASLQMYTGKAQTGISDGWLAVLMHWNCKPPITGTCAEKTVRQWLCCKPHAETPTVPCSCFACGRWARVWYLTSSVWYLTSSVWYQTSSVPHQRGPGLHLQRNWTRQTILKHRCADLADWLFQKHRFPAVSFHHMGNVD